MHILFLTDNFPPEAMYPQRGLLNMPVNGLFKVTMLRSLLGSNFPEGKVFEGYKTIGKRTNEGINVWRVKTYITANE